MFEAKEKSLIIVHNSDTKQCAEFLHGLIGEMNDARIPINAVIIDAKAFAAYPAEQKAAKQKILYIGIFSESEATIMNIIEWEFNKFGISYGWHGSRAVIKFDKNLLPESDFKDMVAYAKQVLKEFNKNSSFITRNVGKRGFNPFKKDKNMSIFSKICIGLGIIPHPIARVLPLLVLIKALVSAYNKKGKLDPIQIKEKQMRFAVFHFSLYHLAEFMGIKENEEV